VLDAGADRGNVGVWIRCWHDLNKTKSKLALDSQARDSLAADAHSHRVGTARPLLDGVGGYYTKRGGNLPAVLMSQ